MKHLGMNYTHWNESKVSSCTFVSEGDEVIVNVKAGANPRCLKGKVIVAAGHHCKVATRDGEFWFNVSDCATANS